MTDFLLELRSEEIPARMQAKARDDLARLVAAELAKAGLTVTDTITYATPRRLALIARGLPDATAAVSEEVKGPRASAPPQALDGFLRKTGLTREQLTERDGVFFAVTDRPGRATAEVLAEAIPVVIRAFPWPKSMRWGDASISTDSLRWVRPLHGIVALLSRPPSRVNRPPGRANRPPGRVNRPPDRVSHPPGRVNRPPGRANRSPSRGNCRLGQISAFVWPAKLLSRHILTRAWETVFLARASGGLRLL